MQFPTKADVKSLNAKHPEYTKNERFLEDLRILYIGGDEMRRNAARFLVKRSAEIGPVYQDRLLSVTYDNLLASIVVWYVSKLFETDLSYDFRSDLGEEGAMAATQKPNRRTAPTPPYYTALLENCDNAGTPFEKFFEKLTADVLVYGSGFFLIDLPHLAEPPATLADQIAAKGLDPYFVYVEPQAIQNWSKDEFGNYEWVLIHTQQVRQSFLSETVNVQRWTYYDQTSYAVYESQTQGNEKAKVANLIDTGLHALAELNQVPLKVIDSDDRLWLGQRVLLPLIDHFNATNSHRWSVWLSDNQIPVFVAGKDDQAVDLKQVQSEYCALSLPNTGDFKFVGPENNAWESSKERIEAVKDAIFRSCHLLSQAKTSKGSDYQSGLSKEVMMQPATDVLNTLGSLVRTAVQNALLSISLIRGDGVVPDCRGWNFSDDMSGEVTSLTLELQSVNVPSDTFKKEMYKRLIRTVLHDANPAVPEQCVQEVETAVLVDPVAPPQSSVALNITERGEVS